MFVGSELHPHPGPTRSVARFVRDLVDMPEERIQELRRGLQKVAPLMRYAKGACELESGDEEAANSRQPCDAFR